MPVPFREVDFGYAAAETEGAENPDLLLSGYFDLHNAYSELVKGRRNILLGYKGSGKTAFAQHVVLQGASDPTLFPRLVFLGDFPFGVFSELIPGTSDDLARYPLAWTFILLLYFVDSFSSDAGSTFATDSRLTATAKTLRTAGLLPAPSLSETVTVTRTFTAALKLPHLGGITSARARTVQHGDLKFSFIVDQLRDATARFRSESRHILLIDGLDDLFSGVTAQEQFAPLGSMFMAASRLNTFFLDECVPAKVVVVCRTDIFDQLPGANTNKLRQDSAINLDWYRHTLDPQSSELLRLATLKAQVTDPTIVNLFDEYMPENLGERMTVRVLLDHTRHTPRDLLQLLKHIQTFVEHAAVSARAINQGIRLYSLNYFLPEVRNELEGHLSQGEIKNVLRLLGMAGSNRTSYAELRTIVERNSVFQELELERALHRLFECSAIGYYRGGRRRRGGERRKVPYYTFRYRNPHATLDLSQNLIIHRGLEKALSAAPP
jgi:hypothetical protein